MALWHATSQAQPPAFGISALGTCHSLTVTPPRCLLRVYGLVEPPLAGIFWGDWPTGDLSLVNRVLFGLSRSWSTHPLAAPRTQWKSMRSCWAKSENQQFGYTLIGTSVILTAMTQSQLENNTAPTFLITTSGGYLKLAEGPKFAYIHCAATKTIRVLRIEPHLDTVVVDVKFLLAPHLDRPRLTHTWYFREFFRQFSYTCLRTMAESLNGKRTISYNCLV